MTTARGLSVFLIALVTTATAAPNEVVDPAWTTRHRHTIS